MYKTHTQHIVDFQVVFLEAVCFGLWDRSTRSDALYPPRGDYIYESMNALKIIPESIGVSYIYIIYKTLRNKINAFTPLDSPH